MSQPEVIAGSANGEATLDVLLVCLQIIAKAHGDSVSRDALMSGLPVEEGRLIPSMFHRAAKRAHLNSHVVKLPLEKLNSALFPVVLLLNDDRACVLLRVDAGSASAQVVYPELTDAPVSVPLEELEDQYIGSAIYARPIQRYDARTPTVRLGRHEHWFWSVITESVPLYRDVLLAAFLANLFALGMPIFTMNIYNRVVPNQAFDTLWVLSIGLVLMLVSDLILRTMRGRFVDIASCRADIKLSAYIMERVLGTRMEQRPVSAGSFASNLRAFESVRDFIGSATVVAFIDLPFGLIFLAAITWISTVMVIPVLVGSVFLILYTLALQGRMHELAETTFKAGAQRNATLIEGLVGFETIKALGAESRIQSKWENGAAQLAGLGAQLRLLSVQAISTSTFVLQLINLTIIVVGVYQIAANELTMGALIACTMLSSRAMGPVGLVAGLMVQYHTASTALASLNEMMERQVERPLESNFISRGKFKGSIEFRDVSFSYPNQSTPSLRNLNFTIKAGEKVAILGRIGSGKTTLQKLVLGLYRPTEGAVLVDGIDLRQLDPAELRHQVGYVQQDVMLFYGSLRENITLGAPLAQDAEVVRAAEIGGILNLVNNHPQGFDMVVGERGESLSGGQRQGVAIARAVINNPSIMLMDEPTSSMDYSSEDEIKKRLGEFSKEKTVILISHRTSLLDMVDRLIVMDGGRIVADGPKEQVMAALRQGRIGKAA